MRALALLNQVHPDMGTTDVLEQLGQPSQSWLRRVARLIGAEHLEETPHLTHRLARCAPHRTQVLTCSLWFALQEFLRGPGLDRDDRDTVGDDVGELSSDPRPLLADRRTRELARLGDRPPGLCGPLANQPARRPGPSEEQAQHGDVLRAGWSFRVVGGLERDQHRCEQHQPPATATIALRA
jgi:hypothetical protein